MTIKLTEAQFKIFNQIQLDKQTLQNEYDRLIKRESEGIVLIAESEGVAITPNTKVELKDGELIFSTKSEVIEEAKVVQD